VGRESRQAFFLNLYHLMTAHAQLLFGPPDSFIGLAKTSSKVCYEVRVTV